MIKDSGNPGLTETRGSFHLLKGYIDDFSMALKTTKGMKIGFYVVIATIAETEDDGFQFWIFSRGG